MNVNTCCRQLRVIFLFQVSRYFFRIMARARFFILFWPSSPSLAYSDPKIAIVLSLSSPEL